MVLPKAGHDAMHEWNIGDPRASAQSIMAWAATNGYITFTHDLDFGAILATTQAQTPVSFSSIEIIRVLHGAQNLEFILRQEPLP